MYMRVEGSVKHFNQTMTSGEIESCGKLVHCRCVVSFNQYFLLGFGGVIYMHIREICSSRGRMESRLKDGEDFFFQ
ncbi:hypothetical protein Hanom_Chr11g01043731 [Helianthus anomalus]